MVGASFNSVGSEALDIQDITLVGDTADGGCWIKWWDPATKTYSDKVVYANPLCDPVTDDDLDYGGWGDEVNWYPITKTFAPGEGFWFSPAQNSAGITTAGSVEKTANQYVGRAVAVAGRQIMVIYVPGVLWKRTRPAFLKPLQILLRLLKCVWRRKR